MFLDYEDPIWGADDIGNARFPARFHVEPVITLDVEFGLPVEQTIGVLDRTIIALRYLDGVRVLEFGQGRHVLESQKLVLDSTGFDRVATEALA